MLPSVRTKDGLDEGSSAPWGKCSTGWATDHSIPTRSLPLPEVLCSVKYASFSKVNSTSKPGLVLSKLALESLHGLEYQGKLQVWRSSSKVVPAGQSKWKMVNWPPL